MSVSQTIAAKFRLVDAIGRLESAAVSSRSSFQPGDWHSVHGALSDTGQSVDLLITPNEVCAFHGTGVLTGRIFNPDTSIVVKSHQSYPDEGRFHSLLVPPADRFETFARMLAALAPHRVSRILAVPYFPQDFTNAVAAKKMLGASVPLVVWVMDDTVIHNNATSAADAEELFDLADIRFVISPEMRDEYESRFERKFYVLPPTVDHRKWQSDRVVSAETTVQRCAMVGNIWSAKWLRELMHAVKKSAWQVDWFGRGSSVEWLDVTAEELREHGIVEQGFLPEDELLDKLAAYPFVVLPTGEADESDDRKHVTLLSLPTRMPFLLSLAQIPMLVVGSARSCAAGFVSRFGVGLQCDYSNDLGLYFAKMAETDFNSSCRDNCASNASIFSDRDLAAWIWDSAQQGKPVYDRFEPFFPRHEKSLVAYVEEEPPRDLYRDFAVIYQTFGRLAKRGYRPDFVMDVGASTGVWSDAVSRVFPEARFILVEPLPDRYPQIYHQLHPEFEWVAAAASNEEGEAFFNVSQDLYGSSLMNPEDNRDYRAVRVQVRTVDGIAAEKQVSGRGILKVDVQFAEHLVLEGARELLARIDFLVLELTLKRGAPEAKTFLEMINDLECLGLSYFDDVGGWRCPRTGALEQKDVVLFNTKSGPLGIH